MIKEQSRFTINPIYVVALALCSICQYTISLKAGLLLGLITAGIALFCINLISLSEKIANKNLRAFLVILFAAALVVVGEYIFELIGTEFLIGQQEILKWSILAVATLAIVPTYFETRLTTKHYFSNMFMSTIAFILMTTIYSAIIEFLSAGTIWEFTIINGFAGFEWANQLFFQLFMVAIIAILFNVIYQASENRRMKFDLQVERYKIQIKRTLMKKAIKQHREEEEESND